MVTELPKKPWYAVRKHRASKTCAVGKINSGVGFLYVPLALANRCDFSDGDRVDCQLLGKQLVLSLGTGRKVSSNNGCGFMVSCRKLLKEAGLVGGERLEAYVKDGVLFVDLGVGG